VGDSTLYNRFIYDQKIRELERDIRLYEKDIEVSRKKLDDLHADKDRLEKYAREEFYMKKPDEDVFIIE
jgi:cell division protein FtsB